MLTKNSSMPFLSFHAIAASRGDGLRPELVDLFKRLAAGCDTTLSESAAGRKDRLGRGDQKRGEVSGVSAEPASR